MEWLQILLETIQQYGDLIIILDYNLLNQYILSLQITKLPGLQKIYNADVAAYAKKDLKIGEKLDGEGGFCSRGKLITSKKSKEEKILPLGLTDGAEVIKNIRKDEVIKINDVKLNLPEEVTKAREYQYSLI